MPVPNSLNGHKKAQPASHVLNVLEQRYHAQFYESISAIMALRRSYLQNGHIFVKGESMLPILEGLGVRKDDFETVQQISDLTGPDRTCFPFHAVKSLSEELYVCMKRQFQIVAC